jgi:hypothetical protein
MKDEEVYVSREVKQNIYEYEHQQMLRDIDTLFHEIDELHNQLADIKKLLSKENK